MAARTPLAQYVLDRIHERQESADEFAKRIGINASGLYKFLRGAYTEPRQATLDKIAAGLNMTPAELLTAVGRGAVGTDPDEVEVVALYRQVPAEARQYAKRMLSNLRIEPVTKLPDGFGRDNDERSQQKRARKSYYERDTVQSMKLRYGFQPAY